MNSEQFKYILAIAEYKSFSKAADALFVTQPYLSKLIGSIEAELGTALFIREAHNLKLTQAGISYLDFIKTHLYAEQKMRANIREITTHKVIELKLGIPTAHGSYILPHIMQKFRSLYPSVHLILEEHNNQTLLDYALNAAVDLCCFSSPEYSDKLDYEVISHEKILLVMPPEHPLGHIWAKGNYDNPLPFPESQINRLSDEEFIVLNKTQGMGKYARNIFDKYNIRPNIVMETKNIETAYRMAAAGGGLTFIPEICTRFSKFTKEPYYYSLGTPPLERQVVIAYTKGRPLSVVESDFINIAKSI